MDSSILPPAVLLRCSGKNEPAVFQRMNPIGAGKCGIDVMMHGNHGDPVCSARFCQQVRYIRLMSVIEKRGRLIEQQNPAFLYKSSCNERHLSLSAAQDGHGAPAQGAQSGLLQCRVNRLMVRRRKGREWRKVRVTSQCREFLHL